MPVCLAQQVDWACSVCVTCIQAEAYFLVPWMCVNLAHVIGAGCSINYMHTRCCKLLWHAAFSARLLSILRSALACSDILCLMRLPCLQQVPVKSARIVTCQACLISVQVGSCWLACRHCVLEKFNLAMGNLAMGMQLQGSYYAFCM